MFLSHVHVSLSLSLFLCLSLKKQTENEPWPVALCSQHVGLHTEGFLVWFLSRALTWVMGSLPTFSQGAYGRQKDFRRLTQEEEVLQKALFLWNPTLEFSSAFVPPRKKCSWDFSKYEEAKSKPQAKSHKKANYFVQGIMYHQIFRGLHWLHPFWPIHVSSDLTDRQGPSLHHPNFTRHVSTSPLQVTFLPVVLQGIGQWFPGQCEMAASW